MSMRTLLRTLFIAGIATFGCAAAQAQLFRAYLASTGSDANPCTVSAPCRLLPAALTAVADGGQIWILDSANYNTGQVTIAKSVAILAIPGAVGSVVMTLDAGSALRIEGSSTVVSLRNLVIRRLDGFGHGVDFVQGAFLEVSDCEISGSLQNGIRVATNGTVIVRDTVIRSSGRGFYAQAGSSSLDRVHLAGNTDGVRVQGTAHVTIADSMISSLEYGVLALADAGQTVRFAIDRSAISGSTFGVRADTTDSASFMDAAVRGSTISRITNFGIMATQVGPGTVTFTVDDNVFMSNGSAAIFMFGGATVYTRGNNTMLFNGDNVTGGSLTPLTPL